jgi:hypothetical protein
MEFTVHARQSIIQFHYIIYFSILTFSLLSCFPQFHAIHVKFLINLEREENSRKLLVASTMSKSSEINSKLSTILGVLHAYLIGNKERVSII